MRFSRTSEVVTDSRAGGRVASSRANSALILTAREASAQEKNLARIVEFFGVPYESFAIDEAEGGAKSEFHFAGSRLLCSALEFLRFLDWAEKMWDGNEGRQRVHSAFVFAGDDLEAVRELVRRLTGDEQLMREGTSPGTASVSDEMEEFCSVMSGLKVAAGPAEVEDTPLLFSRNRMKGTSIIEIGDDSTFVRFEYRGVPIFISTSNQIIDLAAPVDGLHFDVREHFLAAVPIVLYLRWAFEAAGWHSTETSACLIIDDPVLRSNYGFINFKKLLDLAVRNAFSASIAFIPWNWRRGDSRVAQLFNESQEKLSISMHGCDHTAGEFGVRSRPVLSRKVEQAVSRMQLHEEKTGIHCDRLMVFPQGVFSENALAVLKERNFIAAVNTAVSSSDDEPRKITVGSCWDVAIMDYDGFPVFTRRYPSEGIANFAFDILLGKPCLVVIHHDFCRDDYSHLTRFIDQLNGLNCTLSWRNLAEVVRRSFRQRALPPDTIEVEMYGGELTLRNNLFAPQSFSIRRREPDSDAVKEVVSDSGIVAWSHADGYITFSLELNPKESALIRITYREAVSPAPENETMFYKLKTAARRHLCEARDNYLQPALNALGVLR